MEPRLTGVVAWSKASIPVSTEATSKVDKNSEDRQSKKRPRDSSSAAADIAAEKVTEIANTAASSSRKKIALGRAKASSVDVKRSEKGKKKSHEEKDGRGKIDGKGNGKDRGTASITPATKQVSFSASNSARQEGKTPEINPKTKNNVYYKKR